MNILVFLFLPMVAHGELPCPQHEINAIEIQMVVASRHGFDSDVHGLTGRGSNSADQAVQAGEAGAVAAATTDDLLFYLSSHAQAVSDTSAPTMTPWLELRPIGAVGQDALIGSGKSAPVLDERACERSAAVVPDSGSSSQSVDV